MLMQGRSVNSPVYRYGFNNQENDDEVKGQGNSMGAEFWEYDTRSGRRWNIDPKSTVGISPYSAFNNSPIWFSDLFGDTTLPSPTGRNINIGDMQFEVFDGRTQNVGDIKIQPARGTLKSFTVAGKDADNGAARFVAIFDNKTGKFINYGWDKNLNYTFDDFREEEKEDAKRILDNPELYTIYNTPEEARKANINFALSLVLVNPLLKSATNLTNTEKITANVLNDANKGTQATESVIKGFTGHAANQVITRGFKSADILKIVREGDVVQAMGRYGSQTRYTLGGNTVVINAQGKVITVFSNATGTAKGLGKGFFIPFK
jgi:hypothetical protein